MANPNYLFTLTLALGFRDLGMTDAVITPGSRNTPLALAFASTPGIANWIHHDERSAAFFALGLAKTTGRPVALVSTSGTAAAEYLPALTEARHARVPLVALTADRPPELRNVAAPQAIDQVGMYGAAVKWAHEAITPTAGFDAGPYAARLAAAAWTRSQEAPAGPIHINCPLREPLAPVDVPDQGRLIAAEPVHLGTVAPAPEGLEAVAGMISGLRTLLVAGELPVDSTQPLLALAAALEAPILADPLSQLRAGEHDLTRVISTGDTIARSGLLVGRLRPDVVVRFGAPPTSKALSQALTSPDRIPQVVVDDAEWREPTAGRVTMLRGGPSQVAAGLERLVSPTGAGWLERWQEADRRVRDLWSELPFPSEPGVAHALGSAVPGGARVWAASSMPIRDLDSFFGPTERTVEIRANRGANGIDGFLSTVFGSAAARTGPTYGLCGDLSMLHDLTALAAGVRLGIDATVVLINNDGGGIFHFLPQAEHPEFFESHLGTPHGLDFGPLVKAFGARYELVGSQGALIDAIARPPEGILVVEVRTNRTENLELHRAWWAKARAALS